MKKYSLSAQIYRLLLIAACFCMLLASCATSPKKIVAKTFKKPLTETSCKAIQRRLIIVKDTEEDLYAYQKSLRKNDTDYVGLAIGFGIFVWPLLFLFGIKGDDGVIVGGTPDSRTGEYASILGEKKALAREVSLRCS